MALQVAVESEEVEDEEQDSCDLPIGVLQGCADCAYRGCAKCLNVRGSKLGALARKLRISGLLDALLLAHSVAFASLM